MGVEKFSPKEVNKAELRLSGKVENFSRASETEIDLSLIEQVIANSDSKKKGELMNALGMMLNEIGETEEALKDLDTSQRDQVNVVVGKYLDAAVKLDIQEKIRCKKELSQIFG